MSFYNSAAVIARNGSLVPGVLPDGQMVPAYRKCHVVNLLRNFDGAPGSNEQFYFRGGPGLATFDTDMGRLGVLICYDRSFPESWRVLALQSADIVVVPTASYRGGRAESYVYELRTAAVQNGIFMIAANKSGIEDVLDAERSFFGSGCIINPMGDVLAQGPFRGEPALVAAEIDLRERESYALIYTYFRDRRLELYASICDRVIDRPVGDSRRLAARARQTP